MKIGFIDYHLGNYHANKFHSLLTGAVGSGEVEIVAAYEAKPGEKDWCVEKGVKRAKTPREVVKKSDAVIVLCPDAPETHLELAKFALKSGKPVFLDKSIAGSVKDAKKIAALALKNSTPLMSSSSLRFAVEVEELATRLPTTVETFFARGFGKWRGYAVHTLAPALRLFGSDIKRVIDTGVPGARQVTLDDGTRRATIELREAENAQAASPWTFGALVGRQYHFATVKLFDAFYENLMREVLQFFKTANSPVPVKEQIVSVAIEEAAETSLKKGGVWVNVKI